MDGATWRQPLGGAADEPGVIDDPGRPFQARNLSHDDENQNQHDDDHRHLKILLPPDFFSLFFHLRTSLSNFILFYVLIDVNKIKIRITLFFQKKP